MARISSLLTSNELLLHVLLKEYGEALQPGAPNAEPPSKDTVPLNESRATNVAFPREKRDVSR